MTFSLDSKVIGEDTRPPYLEAKQPGEVRILSDGEIIRRPNWDPASPEMRRAWAYWVQRAGCAELLEAS